jgi:PBP1b-binding outer membrane lipoprotein LpoB
MIKVNVTLPKIAAITLISALFIAGCTSQFASTVRKVTYPPDFKYTEQDYLRSNMHQLPVQMAILDKALFEPLDQTLGQVQNQPELQREQVLTALTNMGTIAARLQLGGGGEPVQTIHLWMIMCKIL